jgi:hypothetical protein
MAPELFSEEIKPRQFQPTPSKIDFPFRRNIRNPGREVFDKLSAKLKGQHLPGVELAEKIKHPIGWGMASLPSCACPMDDHVGKLATPTQRTSDGLLAVPAREETTDRRLVWLSST